jgi:hypothetical protein
MKKLLPSIYVISILMSWVLPGFVISYYRYPSFTRYFASFIPFFISFASALIVGLILLLLNIFIFRWEDYDIGKKYFIIIGAYFSIYPVFMGLLFFLQSRVTIGYFGSDPEGSWFMLYCPSMIVYPFIIALVCVIYYIIKPNH